MPPSENTAVDQYYAHSANAAGVEHTLKDHLRAVGHLASYFAGKSCPALSDVAYWAGLLHDLGKYRDEFQQYLRAERDSSTETHHAVYGAALAYRQGCLGPAFAIAGYHAGLHDVHELQNLVEGSIYRTDERVPVLVERFERELEKIAEKESKSNEGELNAIRNRIFQQCLDKAKESPGFFSLTVPTGGGKTLAGMAFALAHAAQPQHQLRRIIVVIPYLSIIEQNATQYRRILDPEKRGIVIEHHSAVNVPEDTGETRPRAGAD